MKKICAVALVAAVVAATSAAAAADSKSTGRRFEYRSKSAEARKMLFELQDRIENFQFGAANVEIAKTIVALDQQFPEVFIWNARARINLEKGRLDDAMKAYDQGYQSIPGSSLDEIQKKTWLGRLHHGKARTLARMGKHEQAWAEVETIEKVYSPSAP